MTQISYTKTVRVDPRDSDFLNLEQVDKIREILDVIAAEACKLHAIKDCPVELTIRVHNESQAGIHLEFVNEA